MISDTPKKPIQIIDFAKIFEKHSTSTFVADFRRKEIIKQLDEFLVSTNVKSPFLLIQGESGIGKTALMANYLFEKQHEIIHYFIEAKRTRLLKSKVFAEHLYYSLGFQYGIDNNNYLESYYIEHLQRRIDFIGENLLSVSKTQGIFIDALDESLSTSPHDKLNSIVYVLNNIDFPSNFRVVVSSSRKINEILELRPSILRNDPILMSGSDKQNKADVEQYFLKNLKLQNAQKKMIDRLVQKSQGNFQYAFLAVKMVKEDEVDIEWLIENPPIGLDGIYEWKLDRIRNSVSDVEILKKILHAMRLISVMWEPPSPSLVSDILAIDPYQVPEVFCFIEQFLDLSEYERQSCRWFHSSFGLFILDEKRTTRREWESIHITVRDYAELMIKRDMHRYCLSQSFLKNLSLYYSFTPDYTAFIRRSALLQHFLADSYLSENADMEELLYGCLEHSIKDKNFKDIVFFYFLLLTHVHYRKSLTSHYHLFALSTDNNKFFNQLFSYLPIETVIDIPNKELSSEYFSRLGNRDPMLVLFESVASFLKGNIDITYVMSILKFLFLKMRDEFSDLSSAYEMCLNYANEWFPDSKENTDEQRVPVTHSESREETDTETNLLAFAVNMTYTVYENWEEPVPNLKEEHLDSYLKKRGIYDIWVREPASEFYHLKRPFDRIPDSRIVRLLKTILRQAHLDCIPLIELYKSLWPLDTRVSKTGVISKKDDIRKAFSECRLQFGKCLECNWLYDDPYPRIILKRKFKYCFIEPVIESS